MNEPQVWTVIGVFGTATFALMGLVSTLFLQTLRSEIGTLGAEVRGEIGMVRTEIKGLDRQIQNLDRDVQGIARRVFPETS